MSKEIDIKALVSHLVRGDGADKCRICMGETSEGQVYLGDTVMMDGDRPVTLADLLEMITGVEVQEDAYLPRGLCSVCTGLAVDAANFSMLCRKAEGQWSSMLDLMGELPSPDEVPDRCTKLYAFLEDKKITIQTEESTKVEPNSIKTGLNKGESLLKEIFSTKSRSVTPLSIFNQKKTHKRFKKLLCKCPICKKEFHCAEYLSRHFKYSSDNQRACHICAEIMSRNDLVKHMDMTHRTKLFDCTKCPALFLSRKKYLKHAFSDHVKGACTCGDCGRTFQSKPGYRAHQNMHIPKICPGCNKVYRNQSCYIHHVRRCCNLDKNSKDIHKTKSKVAIKVNNKVSKKEVLVGLRGSAHTECICDICNKKFAAKKHLVAHIQIVHLKNTHQACPFCGKEFASAHMKAHIRSHENRQFKCSYCNLVLKTKLGHSQHVRLHTGEKPYSCQHCGETFSASSRRSNHIRRMHNSDNRLRFACNVCPARFAFAYRLKRHVDNIHSLEDDDGVVFECPECHIQFKTCRELVHHSRKHQAGIVQQPKKKINPVKIFTEAEFEVEVA